MFFRFRGNNIQIVKSRLDPKTGKAKSVPLGSINRSNLLVSDNLRQNCSPAEIKEIEAWVKRRRDIDTAKQRLVALTLAEQIATATEWFAQANLEDARDAAEEVLLATSALRRTLDQRGLL